MPAPKNKNKKGGNKATEQPAAPVYTAEKLFGIDTIDESVEQLRDSFGEIPIHKFYTGNLKLEYNNVQGRFVTVSQDIPAGTVVFDQLPYAAVVEDQYLPSVCQRCFSACHGTSMRCQECKLVHYCSMTCMRADFALHQLECNTLAKLPTLRYEGPTATLRCIIRATYLSHMEKQYLADEKKKPSQRNRALLQWKPKIGCSWADVTHLMSHEDKIDGNTKRAVMTVMKALGTIMDASVWDPAVAIDAMQLYFRLQVNAHRLQDASKNLIGLGLYAAVSYANHSCNPSCVYHFAANGALVMRTIRPLKKGEEVTYSYINLYEPSFARREKLMARYYFDPQEEGRYEPAVRIKEDNALCGVRCCACGKGSLNYAEIKHSMLPKQVTVQVVFKDAEGNIVTPSAAEGDAAKGETAPVAEAAVEPSHEEKKDFEAETPKIGTTVTCSACSATYEYTQVDRFLQHVEAYTNYALAHLSHNQFEKALEMLENDVVALATASKDKKDPSAVRAATEDYVRAIPEELQMKAPSQSLFKLSPFHYLMLNAYFGLIQLGRLTNDFKLLQKYGQLSQLCISQVKGLENHPEAADAFLAAGDSYAYLGGKAGLLDLVSTRPIDMVVVDPAVAKQMVQHALEAYQKAYKIREICYGGKHALTMQANKRVTTFRKV